MGAGSSSRADSSDEEFEYETQQAIRKAEAPLPPSRPIIKKTLDEVIAADDLVETPPTTRKAFTDRNDNRQLSGDDMTQVLAGEKADRRKGLFGFMRKEDPGNAGAGTKTIASIHDDDSRKGKENQQRGFKLFNWRKDEKKSDTKDPQLQEDIADIEKTFDSMGISSSDTGGEPPPLTKKETAKTTKKTHRKNSEDIIKLEPMRNRSTVRSTRPVTQNGLSMNGSQQSGSGGSRRNFKYSWEQEPMKSPVQSADWTEFSLNKIEGFDLDKFRRLNAEDDIDSSKISAYSGLTSQDDTSNWNYDKREKELLASIEREFLPMK